jgi:hypothetical protein
MVGVRNVVVKLTCLYYHHNNYTLHPSTVVALFLLRTVFSPTNTDTGVIAVGIGNISGSAQPPVSSLPESRVKPSLQSLVSCLLSPVNQLPRAPSVGYLAFAGELAKMHKMRKAKLLAPGSWLSFLCERSSRFTPLLCRLLHVSRRNCTSPDLRAKVHRIIRLLLHNDFKVS